jgi:hypothetical protein
MSYTYLQEQEEEYLEVCFSDTPQFALWKLNPIAERSYSKDNETASCQSSQSGTMSAPLKEYLGEGKLISSAVDSLAKTSHVLEKVQELKGNEAVCGNTWRELLVKFDLNTLSWKTHQCLWDEDLAPSSLTLPKWGMMQSGALLERIMSPLLTNETESGLWPTPCTNGINGGSNSRKAAKKRGMWPTPQANEDAAGTPNGNMQKMLGNHPDIRGTTPEEWVGGTLNPTWVEWLMGWVIGWTDLKPLEMDKFVLWLNSHGKFSQNNK